MAPGLRSMPLPDSVIREATLPTIVTSRPSRIHTVPRPMTTIQWNLAQGSRSSRAGTRVLIAPSWTSLMARAYPRAARAGARGPAADSPPRRAVTRRIRWPYAHLPPRRPPLPLPVGGGDDALDVRARLRGGRREALRQRGGRPPLRRRLRPRG